MADAFDDRLVYDLSIIEEDSFASKIARKYGLTPERADTISKAIVKVRSLRAIGQEDWYPVSRTLPPPFRELLFSDGDTVFAGVVINIITKDTELPDNIRFNTSRVHGDAIWWREMPISPRELYGI